MFAEDYRKKALERLKNMTDERMIEILTTIGSVHEIESNKSLAEVTMDVEFKNEFAVDMSDILSVSVKLTEGRSELVPMKIYVECNTAYSEKITKESRAA